MYLIIQSICAHRLFSIMRALGVSSAIMVIITLFPLGFCVPCTGTSALTSTMSLFIDEHLNLGEPTLLKVTEPWAWPGEAWSPL